MTATRQTNDCGCCDGLEDRTPAPLFNRPGLGQLSYRAGTYGLFKQSMLAGLSSRPQLSLRLVGPTGRPLSGLVSTLASVPFFFRSTGRATFATTDRVARASVVADPTLNGIESLVVIDRRSPTMHDRWESELRVAFFHPPTPALLAIAGSNIRIEGGARMSEISIENLTWSGSELVIELNRPSDAAFSPFPGTRADDDFSIALIDAWAVAGDVLTFYIERTVHEHYLGTANERRSVDDLAQLIGYRLMPGVAAETWLAFMLETSPDPAGGYRPVPRPGLPDQTPIPKRTRIQSIPGPEELPQTYETVEEIEALADWNTLQPRLNAPHIPSNGDTCAWFAGVGLDLSPGDVLLFVAKDWTTISPNDHWTQRRVVSVEPDPEAERTLVRWGSALANLEENPSVAVDVFAMRQRASLFGYNAPDPRLFTNEVQTNLVAVGLLDAPNTDWPFAEISDSTLYLDAIYRGIEPGSWIALRRSGTTDLLAPITNVGEESRSGYSVSARVTRLIVDRSNDSLLPFGGAANTRSTTVRLDSDLLLLATSPLQDPVVADTIELAHDLDPIEEPRKIIVRGRRAEAHRSPDHNLAIVHDDGAIRLPPADEVLVVLSREIEPEGHPGQHRWRLRAADGFEGFAVDVQEALVFQPARDDAEPLSEAATVVGVSTSDDLATLQLEEPLSNVYDRTTTEFFGNVARATHGETVDREVLGSGDGAKSYQQFTLRKNPLTHVRGEKAGTIEAALEIWVNGVRWHEAKTLFGHGPRNRIYITRITDDGKTVVQFGDGESGARLPTGQDNVIATYRTGTGTEGEVDAGQLSLLMTKPLGVRSVTNPIAPAGAVDRQEAADARENAPRSVLTLGRIVSLQDYEDYARNFAGIDKASAVWTWDGEWRGVLITVAGVDGEDVLEGELVHTELVAAMLDAGSSRVPFVVKNYRPDTFRLSAKLRLDPDRAQETVLQAVRDVLSERFSFKARAFGQIVTLSGIYAAIHDVPGVLSADIDHLYRGTDARLDPYLLAEAPGNGDPPTVDGAELLTLHPQSLDDLEVLA